MRSEIYDFSDENNMSVCKPWTARWSWVTQKENNPVSAVWAKTSLMLNDRNALLRISANHGYQLWINGRFTGRGPDRADPKYLYEDTYPLPPEPGMCRLVVLVYHDFPVDRSWCLGDGPPGLIAEINDQNGEVIPVEWEMRRSEAWSMQPGVSSRFLGPVHDIDLAKWRDEWNEAASLEVTWDRAKTLEFGREGYYPMPIRREIPALVEEPLLPGRISHELRDVNPMTGYDTLFTDTRANFLSVTPADSESRLALEFDKVFCGFLELTIEGDGIVDIYFGEGQVVRLQERLHSRGGEAVPYRSTKWRGGDRIVFHFREVQKGLKLSGIRMVDVVYPFRESGNVETSSAEWNTLWNICRNTAHAGVRDHPMDCCGREQALWLEDLYIHGKTLRCCFGDLRPVRKALLQSLRNIQPSGYIPIPGPVSTGYNHAGEILRWSGQALVIPGILREVVFWNPERELAGWALPRVKSLLDFFAGYADAGGLIVLDPPGKQKLQPFCGWNPSPKSGTPCDLNALYAMALRDAAQVARYAEEEDMANEWEARGESIREGIRQRFWSPQHGLFCDGEIKGERLRNFSITANALCGLADAVLPHEAGNWLLGITSRKGLIPPVTPYDASLLLLALCKFEADDAIRSLLSGYFGSIVRAGESLIPEFWQEHGGNTAKYGNGSSRCHAYGSAPAVVFTEHFLGVKSLTAGGSHIRIEPHPLGMWQGSGHIPFPLGMVEVSWRRSDREWNVHIVIPDGMHAEISLPRLGLAEQKILVDEKMADVLASREWISVYAAPRPHSAQSPDERIKCTVEGGRHHIRSFTV